MLQIISRSNLTKSRLSNQSTLSLTYPLLAQPTKTLINTNLRHFPTTLGVTQIKQKLGTHDQPRISTAINPLPNIYLFLSFSLPLKSNHFVSKDQKWNLKVAVRNTPHHSIIMALNLIYLIIGTSGTGQLSGGQQAHEHMKAVLNWT